MDFRLYISTEFMAWLVLVALVVNVATGFAQTRWPTRAEWATFNGMSFLLFLLASALLAIATLT